MLTASSCFLVPALVQAPRHGAARRCQPAPPAAFFGRGAAKPDTSSDRPSATGANTRETLISDGAIKGLSPEARRIFREVRWPLPGGDRTGGQRAGGAGALNLWGRSVLELLELPTDCVLNRPRHARAPAGQAQAQDNIIELNRSRLRALEELKVARQKIAELGALSGL